MSKITCYIYLRYDIRNLYIYTLLTYFWPTCIEEGCREEESDIGEREKKLSFLTLFGPHRRSFHDFETIEFRDVLRGGGSKRPPLRELHNESVRRERKGKNTGWQSRLVRSRLPFLCGDRWNFGSNKERIPRGCFPFLSPSVRAPTPSRFHVSSSRSNSSRVPISFEPLIWLYQLWSVPFCPKRVCILFVPSLERVPPLVQNDVATIRTRHW